MKVTPFSQFMLQYEKGVVHMELKEKLKSLRMNRGLTQAKLASAIYVSRSTVAKWENG